MLAVPVENDLGEPAPSSVCNVLLASPKFSEKDLLLDAPHGWLLPGGARHALSETCGEWNTLAGLASTREVLIGRHFCVNRNCPLCYESGYLGKATRKIVNGMMAWAHASARRGEHVSRAGRALGVYTGYMSFPQGVPVEVARKQAIDIFKSEGALEARIITHPFRQTDTCPCGAEYERYQSNARRTVYRCPRCGHTRAKTSQNTLDKTKASLHFHVAFLAFYYKRGQGGPYRHFNYLGNVSLPQIDRETGKEEDMLGVWRRLSSAVRYELEHAGYRVGGQIAVRFGAHHQALDKKLDKVPRTVTRYKSRLEPGKYLLPWLLAIAGGLQGGTCICLKDDPYQRVYYTVDDLEESGDIEHDETALLAWLKILGFSDCPDRRLF